MKDKKAEYTRRLRLRLAVVGVGFCLMLGGLYARAFWLQVIDAERLASIASRELMLREVMPPRRGVIFDRNHEELAVSLDTQSVYAHPGDVPDHRDAARRLAPILGMSRKSLLHDLSSKKPFVFLARRIPQEKARQVRELKIKGVGLTHEPKRFYPNGSLACHVLGFAGLDAKGLWGLELSQDEVLRGRPLSITAQRDALGRRLHTTEETATALPEGGHIILTLDKHIQYAAEKALGKAVEKYHAAGGQAIVLVPQTGEVLAMASLPLFDPNNFARYPGGTYRNRAVTDMYEPGSTFKIFVAAGALADGRISLEQKFDCEEGAWRIGGRTIHDTHEYDELTLAEIVKYSSNIGAAKVAQAMGPEDLHLALIHFGFGHRTGIDLPGEARGILHPYRSWGPVEMANIAFGQGVSITPIQLAQAVAAVANGGVLMRPHVIKAVLDSNSRVVRENNAEVVGRVMPPREARLLTEMLQAVTEEGGTGTLARVGSLPVAGKTGTAQKVKENGRGYSHSDYMASFVGFVPADDPKVVVLVLLDTPKGQHYGGVVAGPAFAEIARVALNEQGVHEYQSPALAARSAAPAPPAPPAADYDDAVSEALQGLAPDMRGLSLRQVMRLAAQAELPLSTDGWGKVVWQSPEPGRKIGAKGLAVRLAPAQGGA